MGKKGKRRLIVHSPVVLHSRVESVTKLWNVLLPNVKAPPHQWLALGCMHHTDGAIEAAIKQVANEFPQNHAERLDYVRVQRYAIALMENTPGHDAYDDGERPKS